MAGVSVVMRLARTLDKFLKLGDTRFARVTSSFKNLSNVLALTSSPHFLRLPFRATKREEPVESINSKNQQLLGESDFHGLNEF